MSNGMSIIIGSVVTLKTGKGLGIIGQEPMERGNQNE
jgi:hypothetical protein